MPTITTTPIEVLARLRAAWQAAAGPPRADFDVDNAPDAEPAPIINPTATTEQICRCGSTTWRDVPIHDGQSIRRDCGRCGRFIGFPVWYGKPIVLTNLS